jgi:hypothetical protein
MNTNDTGMKTASEERMTRPQTAAALPGSSLIANDLIKLTDELARKLAECLAFSTGWMVKAGQILTEQRNQLSHGEMTAMFNSGRLPLGQRYGQMLSAIARNKALCNPVLLQSLPQSLAALHALATLDARLIEQGIKDGIIHRGLTRQGCLAIVRSFLTHDSLTNQTSAIKPI